MKTNSGNPEEQRAREKWIKITERQPPYGKLVYTKDEHGNIGAYTRYPYNGVGDGWTSLISTDNNAIVEWLEQEQDRPGLRALTVERDLVDEAQELLRIQNFSIMTFQVRQVLSALCDQVKGLRIEVTEFEKTDLVPRSRYKAVNADWLEAREQTKQLARKAETEINRLLAENQELKSLNSTQAENIQTFQEQAKLMREAIQSALSWLKFLKPRTEASVEIERKLRAAISPKG